MVSEQNLGGELAHNEFRKPKSTVYYKKKTRHTLETYRSADEREGLGGHVLMGRRGGQGPQAARQRTDRVDGGVRL